MCSSPSGPEHCQADGLLGKRASRQVFKVCIIQLVEHSEPYREDLWAIVLINTWAILERYLTYLQVPNEQSLKMLLF